MAVWQATLLTVLRGVPPFPFALNVNREKPHAWLRDITPTPRTECRLSTTTKCRRTEDVTAQP